jgi:polyvinyl alcohol dehydrogenase (cytochrome)
LEVILFKWLLKFKRSGRLIVFSMVVAMLALSMIAASSKSADWIFSGQGITNWRYQPSETTIAPSNASKLGVKFAFPNVTGGDVSATPAVYNGSIYFPDWSGYLYSVNAVTGAINWSENLSTLTGIPGMVSRSTPTVQGNSLIVGTLKDAWLLSINRSNGSLQWKSQLDSQPAAVLTQSPVVYNNMIYIGVSSYEEGLAANPSYNCCTFRGSFEEVNLNSGAIMWKTYTAPDNGGQTGGYSGNAVWGSTPSIDPARQLVYIGTGNNYTVPASVVNDPTTIDPTDYTDALLALDMANGKVVWADPLMGLQDKLDTWTVACFTSQAGDNNCPSPKGPDYDFGQAPMIINTKINGVSRELVVAGQKSGDFWAVDPDTGAVVWKQDTGPGSALGGMEWGSATDGTRIYLANAAGGFWEALDPATGNVIWKTSDPNPDDGYFGVKDIGAVSVANGVVYVGSIGGDPSLNQPASSPTMFALDAATGNILWQFTAGSSVGSGPAIANGMLYWGAGYSRLAIGSGAGKYNLYAFTLK